MTGAAPRGETPTQRRRCPGRRRRALAARSLLGEFLPGDTAWHRAPVAVKYVVFVVLTAPAVVWGDWTVAAGSLAASLVVVATTGAPLRLAWGVPSGMWWLLGILAGYHLLTGAWDSALRVTCLVLAALIAFRIVLFTTPWPELIDALVRWTRPLERLGFPRERFGLAVAVMIRSVPWVLAAFGEVRQAARARGLERSPLSLITPVVVMTVAHARDTGEALAARGLAED